MAEAGFLDVERVLAKAGDRAQLVVGDDQQGLLELAGGDPQGKLTALFR